MRLSLIVLLLSVGMFLKSAGQDNRLKINSIYTQYGLTNSFMVKQLILKKNTTVGNSYHSSITNYVPISGRFEIAANIGLSQKQSIDLGLSLKKYQYRYSYCGPSACADYDLDVSAVYFVFQIDHQYKLGKLNKLQATVSNGIQLDFLLSSVAPNALRKLAFSYIGKFNLYYQINALNSIVLSPEYTMAFGRYNKREVKTAFLPYSCGLMLGFSHRV